MTRLGSDYLNFIIPQIDWKFIATAISDDNGRGNLRKPIIYGEITKNRSLAALKRKRKSMGSVRLLFKCYLNSSILVLLHLFMQNMVIKQRRAFVINSTTNMS